MPELPEVETVRRMLEASVGGHLIRSVRLSGLALREPIPRTLPARLSGRRIAAVRRRGKYLLIDLDAGLTLLSHLGMSGRWLFHAAKPARTTLRGVAPGPPGRHVHAVVRFSDGSQLWFEDPRRFGLLRLARTDRLPHERALAGLGPDPLSELPSPKRLRDGARGVRANIKSFLLDQRRLAGIGNIYASEILHRAGVDPRLAAGRLTANEWSAVARETPLVLSESIERMGTTFSMYRTVWGEPGGFADQLRVYDREGEPCRACGTPVRRIVQSQRSTFFCARCQRRRAGAAGRPRRRAERH